MPDPRDYRQLELALVTDLEKLKELAQKHGQAQVQAEASEAVRMLHLGGQSQGADGLLQPLHVSTSVIQRLRQYLQSRVSDWQKRDGQLQQAKLLVDSPVRPAIPPFSIEPLRQYLARDSSWKDPLRQVIDQELPELTARPEGLLARFKSSLDNSGRERIARDLFQRLVRALESGLRQYEHELLLCLDRLWDDFLDTHGQGASAAEGLRRNRESVQFLLATLRQRLSLTYGGGFSSWLNRPVSEIRREVEGELIRQLGVDLGPVYREWVERIEAALTPTGAPAGANTEALRQWVRQSVLLEQEQTELRTDWLQLHAVEERLRLLRENLAHLSQS